MLESSNEYPEFDSHSESFSWIGDKSPFTSAEILEMNFEKLIKHLLVKYFGQIFSKMAYY